ncbi:MAG: hypothetical protein U0223_00360 [Nitrospira sp.]
MVMKLDDVASFDCPLDEYERMFALSSDDLDTTIIGVGDGPPGFNEETFERRKSMISVDLLYVLPSSAIERQFSLMEDTIIDQLFIAKPIDTDGHGDGFGQSCGHEMLVRLVSTGGGFCAPWWKESRGGAAIQSGRGECVPPTQAGRRGLQTPRPSPISQAGLGTLAPSGGGPS